MLLLLFWARDARFIDITSPQVQVSQVRWLNASFAVALALASALALALTLTLALAFDKLSSVSISISCGTSAENGNRNRRHWHWLTRLTLCTKLCSTVENCNRTEWPTAPSSLYMPSEPTTATTATARSQRTRSCCSLALLRRSSTLCVTASLAHALIPTASPSAFAAAVQSQFLATVDRRAAAAAAVIESSSAVLQLQLAALAGFARLLV